MKIAVIQNKPTQFDVPLYNYVTSNSSIKIYTFYSSSHAASDIDPEINVKPTWDNIEACTHESYVSRSVWVLFKQIRRLKPSIVIISGWHPKSHAMLTLLLFTAGIPLGLRADNIFERARFHGVRGRIKALVLSAWLRLFSSFHPVGYKALDYLKRFSRPNVPTALLPYAVDNQWFKCRLQLCVSRRVELRKTLGFEPDDFVIIGVLKWTTREDPLTLVRGFLRFASVNSRAKLLLVGDGPLRRQVFDLLASAPGKWCAPGYVPYSALPSMYSVSDLFVHPAENEPYGVSLHEALICGLPILASRGVGAAADFIVDGKNGSTFAIGDDVQLCELIMKWASGDFSEIIRSISFDIATQKSYEAITEDLGRCIRKAIS